MLGVHFEEVLEMVEEISPLNTKVRLKLQATKDALRDLSDYLKTTTEAVMLHPADRVAFVDAVCDQIVTATGCAVVQKMDPVGGLTEVNRSNFSKFNHLGNPIYNANGKIAKGPNYIPADLTDFV